jgi:enoyl-CoA hydratase/carnithine racemase
MSAITVRRDGHVALVAIDRPPNNHVSVDLIGEIADALDGIDADVNCRAVVLASEGKVFCGGADLTPSGPDGGKPGSMAGDLYRQAERLFRTRKPIIAAVQGAAVGAGLGLALVADFRVAAAEARLSANFAKLGFHSGFGISLTLPRVVGLQAAALLLQTGRRVTGEEAFAIGLVDQLAPLAEVRTAAFALAHEIAANAPLAVQAMRATLRQGFADAVRARMTHELAVQTVQRATADFAEGVRAVAARRPGRFTGL